MAICEPPSSLLLVLLVSPANAQVGNATAIRRVELLESAEAELPPPSADWRPFVLPYQKPLDRTDAGFAWFRFTLPSPDSDEMQSLYINNHLYGIKVWLNGEEVGGSDAPPGRQATGWNLPLLLRLPASAWREDNNNEMVIRLELHRFTNVLASVFVGAHDELWPLWQQRHFSQGQLSQFSFYLCAVLGLFMLGLWACRRHDTQYLWFGVSSLCWSVPMLYMAVSYAPIRHDWLLVLTLIGINFHAVTAIRFLHRLLKIEMPNVEGWHLSLITAVSFIELFASAKLIMPLSLLADMISLIVLLNVLRLCCSAAMCTNSSVPPAAIP